MQFLFDQIKLELANSEFFKGRKTADRNYNAPLVLYHYTSVEGFYGIITSHNLWASNVYFLNDYSEIKYGCNIVAKTANILFKIAKQSLKENLLEDT
jgi:hypothetical protein